MTGIGDNRLAVLAADIQAAHQDVARGALAVAERALAAGRMLLEAQALLEHGQWAAWLAAHTGLSARTARRYMQLTRSGVESATVANLGIRGTAQRLARLRVRQPPLGYYAMAVANHETQALVWRDIVQPDRFHVVVFGSVDGQDHCVTATHRPVPPELLSRCVIEAGFPDRAATFAVQELTEQRARACELFRQMAFA